MNNQTRALAAISFLFLINGVVFGVWATNIPHVKSAFSLGEAALGTVLLFMAGGAVAFMTGAGILVSRLGSRGLSMLSALGFAVALPLVFLAPSLPWLILAVVLLGAGTGAMDVTMNQQAALLEKTNQRPMMSFLHAWFSIGAFVGALWTFGGAWLGLGPLAQSVLLLLAICAVASVLFPSLLSDRTTVKTAQSTPSGDQPQAADGRAMFRNRGLMLLGLLSFLTMMSEGGIADWSTLYLQEYTRAGATYAPLGFASYAALMILARLFGDRLVMRLGRRRVVFSSGILLAVGMGLVLFVPVLAVQMAGLAICGLGVANLIPVIFSVAGQMDGLPQGAGISFVSVAGYSGFLLGPVLIAGLAEVWGLDRALAVIIGVGLVMALAAQRFSGRASCSAPA